MKSIMIVGLSLLIIVIFYLIAKRSDKARKAFAVLSMLYLIAFMIWRGLYTIPFSDGLSMAAGLVFYAAEMTGLIVFLLFISLVYNYKYDCAAKPEKVVKDDYQPKVDVFICTSICK